MNTYNPSDEEKSNWTSSLVSEAAKELVVKFGFDVNKLYKLKTNGYYVILDSVECDRNPITVSVIVSGRLNKLPVGEREYILINIPPSYLEESDVDESSILINLTSPPLGFSEFDKSDGLDPLVLKRFIDKGHIWVKRWKATIGKEFIEKYEDRLQHIKVVNAEALIIDGRVTVVVSVTDGKMTCELNHFTYLFHQLLDGLFGIESEERLFQQELMEFLEADEEIKSSNALNAVYNGVRNKLCGASVFEDLVRQNKKWGKFFLSLVKSVGNARKSVNTRLAHEKNMRSKFEEKLLDELVKAFKRGCDEEVLIKLVKEASIKVVMDS